MIKCLCKSLSVSVLIIAILLGAIVSRYEYKFIHFEELKDGDTWKNWGETHGCKAAFRQPTSEKEIIDIVKQAASEGRRVRVTGSGHSWENVTCAEGGYLLNLDNYTQILNLDVEKKQVTIQGGIRIKALKEYLAKFDLEMKATTLVDYLTVSGAILTSSHGQRYSAGSMATMVASMRMVTADGSILTVTREETPELFQASVVGFGLFGVVSEITLNLHPRTSILGNVMLVPFNDFGPYLDQFWKEKEFTLFLYLLHTDNIILAYGDNADLPLEEEAVNEVLQTRIYEDWFRFYLNSIAGELPSLAPSINKFVESLVTPHELIWPSSDIANYAGKLQFSSEMEYIIPKEKAFQAAKEVREALMASGITLTGAIGLRPVRGDDFWMSMAYKQDSFAVEVHNYNLKGDRRIEQVSQNVLRKYGRPHWGKQNHIKTGEDVAEYYEKWEDFKKLRAEVDPNGLFLNEYWETLMQ
eukprot:TRINITY_DN952_c0_g3_i1.p1 TRINITY_DN952_c0_g3~~TRINITY_DN952_c0_g3_i1.p1  ORF type:complete len:470 (-),score=118.46 TRINITY_DN952_c0_g3_i1:24-1433(-)